MKGKGRNSMLFIVVNSQKAVEEGWKEKKRVVARPRWSRRRRKRGGTQAKVRAREAEARRDASAFAPSSKRKK